MSGSNPLFRVDDVFGDDLFGDRETAELNEALTDAGDALDDADEEIDDIAEDVEAAADDADERFDDLAEDVEAAVEGDDDAGPVGGSQGGADTAGGSQGGTGTAPAGAALQVTASLLLPANNSGVFGFAIVSAQDNLLDARLVATNATPGQVHPLHLHGFADGRVERLPTLRDDLDGDGVGETPEGESLAFGPVIAGLTTNGEAQQGLEVSPNYPVADAAGRITFVQTYRLDANEADDAGILGLVQQRLAGRVIELHGVNVPAGLGAGTPNEANGTAGYNPQVPVAAGQLLPLPALQGDLAAIATIEGQAAFLNQVNAYFTALAPFTLRPDGAGPLAADPFFATAAPAQPGTAPGGNVTVNQSNTAVGGGTNANVTQSNIATVGNTAAAGSTAAGGGTGGAGDGSGTYTALLLPTNNSGVFGAASISFEEAAGRITVDLDLAGLEAGQKHATHIHGFTDDRASIIPNLQVDTDRDGFLQGREAAPDLGPVLFGVTEDGSISDALAANYAEADGNGRISLNQTYQFDLSSPEEAAIFKELADRLEGRALQVHGVTVPATNGEGTRGEVDGTAGYKPLLAVANGVILDTDGPGGAFAAALGAAVQQGLDDGAVDFTGLVAAFQPGTGGTLIA